MKAAARPETRTAAGRFAGGGPYSIDERFDSNVIPEPMSGCFLWIGGVFNTGYGQFCTSAKTWRAHRFAYVRARGPIPEGLVLDHLCRNKLCVNPLHLEAVTNRVNTIRGIGPASARANRPRCVRGHDYDRITKKGARKCSTCEGARARRRSRSRSLDKTTCTQCGRTFVHLTPHLRSMHSVGAAAALFPQEPAP